MPEILDTKGLDYLLRLSKSFFEGSSYHETQLNGSTISLLSLTTSLKIRIITKIENHF